MQVDRDRLDVDFLRRVTISYPWDETAPTFQPVGWDGKSLDRPAERIRTIAISYQWSDSEHRWVGHIRSIIGSRVKKDGTPYKERMELWRRNLSKEERTALIEEHRPTSTIEWYETETGRA